MESGIYDEKGRLIKNTIERIGGENIPDSASQETGQNVGNVLQNTGGTVYSSGNYHDNIIIRDSQGNIAVFIGTES